MFALAEAAGKAWEARCARAFELLTGGDDETENIRIELLTDIRRILQSNSLFYAGKAVRVGDPEKDDARMYNPKATGRIFTSDLLSVLEAVEESPWAEVRNGKPINDRWLSRALREFKIKSKNLRIKEKLAKGYELVDFTEAFSRFLTAPKTNFEVVAAAA